MTLLLLLLTLLYNDTCCGKIHLRTFAVWKFFLLLCLYCCCVVNNINHVLIRHSNHKFNSRYSRGIGLILLILHKQNHNGKVQTSTKANSPLSNDT